MSTTDLREHYRETLKRIYSLIEGADWISAMATVVCELHSSFDYYHWTGFYRATSADLLVIGPYQGGHGCLEIPFSKGVCGAAATTRATQRIADVNAFDGHIACSATTQSEIVGPVVTPDGRLLGVLDVDSDEPDRFDAVDAESLESLCIDLGRRYAKTEIV